MEALIGFLPLLLLLACPLMMMFCFWGMRRMGGDTEVAPAAAEPVAATLDLPLSERIAALQSRLDQLKTEQDDIAIQLAELAWMEAAQDTPDEAQSRLHPATSDTAITGPDA